MLESIHLSIQNDPLSEIHVSTKVASVQPRQQNSPSPGFTVALETSKGGEEIHASHVFSTLPAFQFAPVVEKSLPSLAQALQEIKFVSMGMIHVGFNNKVLASDGFGYLVPSCEGEKVLGVVFDSNAFPSQNAATSSSASQTRLSVMCGGAHFPQIANMGLDQVENLARDAVKRHLGIAKEPDFVRAMLVENCIPQYHVGFWKTLERIEKQLAPGMSLGGNSFYGVGLADSVTRSKVLALEYAKTLT